MSEIMNGTPKTDAEKTKKFIREVQQKINDIVFKKLDEEGVCYADDPDIIECLRAIWLYTPFPENSGWTKEGYSRDVQTK